MKKSITALAAIAFVGAISSTAFAGPVGRFDNGYLDEHPEVAEQLGRDPGWWTTRGSWPLIRASTSTSRTILKCVQICRTIPTASWRASVSTITTRDGTAGIR